MQWITKKDTFVNLFFNNALITVLMCCFIQCLILLCCTCI